MKTKALKAMPIQEVFRNLPWRYRISPDKKIIFFLNWIEKYHALEDLTDGETVYPRGYDFLYKVFVPAEKIIRMRGKLSEEEKEKNYLYFDFQWTQKWVKSAGRRIGKRFPFLPERAEMRCLDLCKYFLLIRSSQWNTWLGRHSDFKTSIL